MKKIIKDPLFHFVLLGAIIFIVYRIFNHDNGNKNDIVVSRQDINNLSVEWFNKWNKPPTPIELKTIIDDHIKEEVLYREALESGLDKDDNIVRRRLTQKMKFILDDNIDIKEPSEDEVRKFYNKNKTHYKSPALISLKQITFLGGEIGKEKAQLQLEKLKENPALSEISSLGNSTSIPYDIKEKNKEDIDRLFGLDFNIQLDTEKLNQWQGPYHSGYGYHLVYIYEVKQTAFPLFEQLKGQVKDDWLLNEKEKLHEQKLKELKAKYSIRIDTL